MTSSWCMKSPPKFCPTWADSDLMDMRMSFVWLPTITNVSRLTLTVDGDMVRL